MLGASEDCDEAVQLVLLLANVAGNNADELILLVITEKLRSTESYI